jgi:hypothetical protein
MINCILLRSLYNKVKDSHCTEPRYINYLGRSRQLKAATKEISQAVSNPFGQRPHVICIYI